MNFQTYTTSQLSNKSVISQLSCQQLFSSTTHNINSNYILKPFSNIIPIPELYSFSQSLPRPSSILTRQVACSSYPYDISSNKN